MITIGNRYTLIETDSLPTDSDPSYRERIGATVIVTAVVDNPDESEVGRLYQVTDDDGWIGHVWESELRETVTRAVALSLRYGAVLHHRTERNADGTPLRVRVSGRCQTWKTRPEDFRMPVKYGMYQSLAITPANASDYYRP